MTKEEQLEYLRNHEAFQNSRLFYEEKMINTDKTIPISELVERFIEIDMQFNAEPWNLSQILNNIDIIVPVEDRKEKDK